MDPARGDLHVRDLHAHVSELLSTIDHVLAADAAIRIGLHDMVAEALSDGIWAFANKTNIWQTAADLLEQTRPLAAGDVQRAKQAREIETLRKNAEDGNDWCSPGYWDLPDITDTEWYRIERADW